MELVHATVCLDGLTLTLPWKRMEAICMVHITLTILIYKEHVWAELVLAA